MRKEELKLGDIIEVEHGYSFQKAKVINTNGGVLVQLTGIGRFKFELEDRPWYFVRRPDPNTFWQKKGKIFRKLW